MKRIEIMAPAGSWEALRAAIIAGCDSVYFGSKILNMRANAKNFELNEISKVVSLCHENDVKAYMTLNTIVYEDDLEKVKIAISAAKKANVDAIIAWDLAVIQEAKKQDVNVHISTQASVSNSGSLNFYADLGAKCVVLARELNLEDIQKIVEHKNNSRFKNVKIEVFAHGAMCVSESGRCFISQFSYGHSANKGDCLQPCRRQYHIKDFETGKELVLDNNYVMSPKDLCTIEIIEQVIESGVDILKIEGRNRSPEYVKTVVECYREAIDSYYQSNLSNELKHSLVEKVSMVYNRKFHTGFFVFKPGDSEFTNIYGSDAKSVKKYVGKVLKYYDKIDVFEIVVESEEIKKGDDVLVMGKTTGVVQAKVKSIHDGNRNELDVAKKNDYVGIKLNVKNKLRTNDKVFVVTFS